MATVGVLISSLINALIIGWLARRLLGTPVGWPRTLALSLIVNASTAPLLTWALPQLGVHEVLEWNPDAGAAVLVITLFGAWMIAIHVYGFGEGWGFLAQPWMATKLLAVTALSGWHGFLAGELKRIAAGTSTRSGRFWRMTNEIPFLIAIIAVMSVTTQWTF